MGLQQYDKPETILSAPATSFVASFVGRDRGYRGLSFRSAQSVTMHSIDTATESEVKSLRLDQGQWVLVVDSARRPLGWIDVTGVEKVRDGRSLEDSTAAGGSLFTQGGDLRQALDSAISSPSGIGVAVDETGAAVGSVDAAEILENLAVQRKSEDEERNRHHFSSGQHRTSGQHSEDDKQ